MHGTTALPLGHSSSRPDVVRSVPVTSVLICDDRPDIRRGLAERVGQGEFFAVPVDVVGVGEDLLHVA